MNHKGIIIQELLTLTTIHKNNKIKVKNIQIFLKKKHITKLLQSKLLKQIFYLNLPNKRALICKKEIELLNYKEY
jgi:hypothetical protein